MNSTDLAFAGAAVQAEMIRNGDVSSVEVVQAALDRIDRHDGLLNSFRVVLRDQALADAAAADAARSDGGGSLNGVPVAIKDDTDVAGQSTLVGTNATDKTPKTADAEVVKRLRDAGAVIIGKTNVPELTQWPFTETDAFGVTRNPWNTSHTPGGSSGGSAAAVAAGFAAVALGSDGGGSIRIPAACCGLFGIKTQRGRVPLAPKQEAWHGLSVYGPLARTVMDAALFLDVTGDRAPGESPFVDAVGSDPGKLRIAFSTKTPLPGPVGKDQKAALARIVGVLEGLGHSATGEDPKWGSVIPAFIPRYLRGIGDDAKAVENFDALESRTKGMAKLGSLISDKRLQASLDAESKVAGKINSIFDSHDLLLTPVLAAQPLPVGKYAGKGTIWTFNGVARFTPFSAPFNLTGQPAVSIPAGFDSDGLPLSVQIVGPANSEALLIAVAAQIEAAAPWADSRPQLPA
ncbi:MAG: amidase [Solirubrobacterales bacterium]|nr:amidase [Solirubrobacterales bacterium]